MLCEKAWFKLCGSHCNCFLKKRVHCNYTPTAKGVQNLYLVTCKSPLLMTIHIKNKTFLFFPIENTIHLSKWINPLPLLLFSSAHHIQWCSVVGPWVRSSRRTFSIKFILVTCKRWILATIHIKEGISYVPAYPIYLPSPFHGHNHHLF